MIADFRTISILPNSTGAPSMAFLEVIAYLKGVADTVSAQADSCGPVSVRPISARPTAIHASTLPPALLRSLSLSPLSVAPNGSSPSSDDGEGAHDARGTMRFGDLPFERGSVWPQVPVGSSWEPTRGGARLLELGSTAPSAPSDAGPVIWRRTLPYGAPTVSLAACPPSIPAWDANERASEVRLRTADLPREWYELTGSETGATY